MQRKLISITSTFVIEDYREGDEEILRAEIAGASDDEAAAIELPDPGSSVSYLETEVTQITDAD